MNGINCLLSSDEYSLSSHPHSLAVGQQNTFVLFLLMLHEDSHLFA